MGRSRPGVSAERRVLSSLFFLLLALLMGISVQAAEPRVRVDAPREYLVQPGDTLWSISRRFLHNPWLWPVLWHENPEITNPDLIYPGDILALTQDEQGRVQLKHKQAEEGSVIKLSPSVRISSYRQAVPAIPLQQIAPFIERHQVFTEEQLENSGYILAIEDNRIVAGLNDRVYVRGAGYSALGSRYLLYRQEKAYQTSPFRPNQPEQMLGYEMRYIGTLELESQDDEVASMRVVQAKEEVREKDIVTLQDMGETPATFYPNAPSRQVYGEIISMLEGVGFGGRYSVVAINLGSDHHLVPGNVLTISASRDKAKDARSGDEVSLPPEETGYLMVFRTFARVSYALVMEAGKPVKVGDLLAVPDLQ